MEGEREEGGHHRWAGEGAGHLLQQTREEGERHQEEEEEEEEGVGLHQLGEGEEEEVRYPEAH